MHHITVLNLSDNTSQPFILYCHLSKFFPTPLTANAYRPATFCPTANCQRRIIFILGAFAGCLEILSS